VDADPARIALGKLLGGGAWFAASHWCDLFLGGFGPFWASFGGSGEPRSASNVPRLRQLHCGSVLKFVFEFRGLSQVGATWSP
jgi:hypothetical protein